MTVTIRSMVEDDIAALAAIVAENYDAHCAEAFHHEARCAFYHYPFKPRFVVAQIDGRVVGCACWTSDWCSWGVFNLSWVQVDQDLQGNGIGKLLVNTVMAELRPQAVLILLATTKPEYYQKHWGFRSLQRYRASLTYEIVGEVETLMGLVI